MPKYLQESNFVIFRTLLWPKEEKSARIGIVYEYRPRLNRNTMPWSFLSLSYT